MKKIISLILIILWMGFIFYLSSMDSSTSNDKSKSIVSNIVDKIDNNVLNKEVTTSKNSKFMENMNYLFRKLSHVSVYLALAILVFNYVIQLRKRKILMYDVITLIVCFIYACTDEYHQTFIVGRSGSIMDVLIDMIGVVIGCVIINAICIFIKKKRYA